MPAVRGKIRISSGLYRGRKLLMPRGIRPTQDKVRKAVFDILGDLEGWSFLELFSGSGAVGLEACSRGAKEVAMVEANRDCLQAINRNIAALKARGCQLYALEADKAVKWLFKQGKKFDIIFLDPPYYKGLATPRANRNCAGVLPSACTPRAKWNCAGVLPSAAKKTLQTLGGYDILTPRGFIIAQHFKRDNLPETEGKLFIFKQAAYGDTLLSFYQKGP